MMTKVEGRLLLDNRHTQKAHIVTVIVTSYTLIVIMIMAELQAYS